MATSKFSFTLGWPMNSCRRCGRSLSSKEESSSTGAAETRRSFVFGGTRRAGLSLAADTEGDGKAKCCGTQFWLSSSKGWRSCASLDGRRRPSLRVLLLAYYSQTHPLQLSWVEPGYFLSEPGFCSGEFVLFGGGREIAGA